MRFKFASYYDRFSLVSASLAAALFAFSLFSPKPWIKIRSPLHVKRRSTMTMSESGSNSGFAFGYSYSRHTIVSILAYVLYSMFRAKEGFKKKTNPIILSFVTQKRHFIVNEMNSCTNQVNLSIISIWFHNG